MSKLGQKSAFLPYLQNATSDFDESWPKVGEYGLSLNGIGLYAGKILDLEIIHLIPWRTIKLRKLKAFELRYEWILSPNGMKTYPYM